MKALVSTLLLIVARELGAVVSQGSSFRLELTATPLPEGLRRGSCLSARLGLIRLSMICGPLFFALACEKREQVKQGAISAEVVKPATTKFKERDHNPILNYHGLRELHQRSDWLGLNGAPVKMDQGALLAFLKEAGAEAWDLDGDMGGYLQSLFFWCEPGDVDQVLEIFTKTRGAEGKKNLYFSQIIERAASSKEPGAFSALLTSIRKNFGNGQQGLQAKMLAFGKGGFSAESLSELHKLKNPDEQKKMLSQMATSLQWEPNLHNLAGFDSNSLSTDERTSLFKALASRLENARGLGMSSDAVMSETMAFAKGMTDASSLLVTCAQFAPADVWDLLPKYGNLVNSEDLEKARQAAIAGIARENGEAALSKVIGFPSGPARLALFQSGLQSFVESNPAAAEGWINGNKDSLSSTEIDVATSSLSECALKNNELDAAKLLVQQIKDPSLREKAQSQCWQQERDNLRKEVANDPGTSLGTFLSGQSRYDDPWLEEAMSSWISKDPAKAEEWYQSNWKSLPANKSQYVAAAYANEALKQGDEVSASQWAAYIKDPKTKQRIQDEINRAATNRRN